MTWPERIAKMVINAISRAAAVKMIVPSERAIGI